MKKFVKWQNQDNPLRTYLFFLGLGALIFPTGIPAILVIFLPQLDKRMGIGSFYFGGANTIIGVLSLIAGALFAFWTIFAQIKWASGTPFPMLPTKRLLTIGPFQYCRNPMALGTIMAYSGIVVMIGSYTSLLFVALFTLALVAYIKWVEEKELALRFGQEYLDYKKATPFILPVRVAVAK